MEFNGQRLSIMTPYTQNSCQILDLDSDVSDISPLGGISHGSDPQFVGHQQAYNLALMRAISHRYSTISPFWEGISTSAPPVWLNIPIHPEFYDRAADYNLNVHPSSPSTADLFGNISVHGSPDMNYSGGHDQPHTADIHTPIRSVPLPRLMASFHIKAPSMCPQPRDYPRRITQQQPYSDHLPHYRGHCHHQQGHSHSHDEGQPFESSQVRGSADGYDWQGQQVPLVYEGTQAHPHSSSHPVSVPITEWASSLPTEALVLSQQHRETGLDGGAKVAKLNSQLEQGSDGSSNDATITSTQQRAGVESQNNHMTHPPSSIPMSNYHSVAHQNANTNANDLSLYTSVAIGSEPQNAPGTNTFGYSSISNTTSTHQPPNEFGTALPLVTLAGGVSAGSSAYNRDDVAMTLVPTNATPILAYPEEDPASSTRARLHLPSGYKNSTQKRPAKLFGLRAYSSRSPSRTNPSSVASQNEDSTDQDNEGTLGVETGTGPARGEGGGSGGVEGENGGENVLEKSTLVPTKKKKKKSKMHECEICGKKCPRFVHRCYT